MTIQVITDSTSDIPQELATELGIRVIPIYVRFGDRLLRDGVDIKTDEFFRLLTDSRLHPATSQPTPEDFELAYREYCGRADGIISVHISSKISGTCNAALLAKKAVESRCPIEVIDSRFNSAGLALVAMAAARLAGGKKDLKTIAEEVRKVIGQVHMLGMFDTMKYLAWSGRVPRAIVAAANILNVKPMLAFRDGEIVRTGLVRSFTRGAEKLYEFVQEKKDIAELVITHSAIPEKAAEFKKRLGRLFPEEKIRVMEMGAGLGVHGGPGVLLVGLRQSG
ncbi:MAG: DegV family protein [Dehalococcoidales bacterium]|jgi:DegV family protein with EDD domain